MSEQRFVSDVIGDRYQKQWSRGDAIFINAPTGSGKSYFILHNLLEYTVAMKRRILYLVNRKVLKKQIERELNSSVTAMLREKHGTDSISDYISVYTYQHIENQLKGGWRPELDDYDYVVYDECHYFYADSNFNTNTERSFDFLCATFANRIQIFISATIEKVQELIVKRREYILPQIEWFHNFNPYREPGHELDDVLSYDVKRFYDFIQIHAFNKQEDLKFIIQKNSSKNNHKWLIFTDSIKNGKKLQSELISNDKDEECLAEEDVVFIDAEYEKEEDAVASVKGLVAEGCIKKKVIIATPVLDNGISFFDKQLRNIVILSDTEEEFIQMLGRKRGDGEKIDLYVCKRSVDYFRNRAAYVEKLDNFLERCHGWEEDVRTPTMRQALYRQKLIDDILSNKLSYECASKVCYANYGEIIINSFSKNRVKDLKTYYIQMIEAMEEDEDAFLKEQMEWLGKGVEEIDEIVATTEEEIDSEYRERVRQKIEQVLGKEMNKEDNVQFKNSIRDCIRYFLKKRSALYQNDKEEIEKVQSVEDTVTKPDRTLAKERFDYCMELMNLPYAMEKPNRSRYKIIEISAKAM